MPQSFVTRYSTDNNDYSFSLRWDEEELQNGEIHFGLTASKIPRGERNERDRNDIERNVDIRIVDDENELPSLKIDYQGKEILKYGIDDIFSVEAAIEKIPPIVFGGDPIVGCMIRSGISVTVGQIIKCKNQLADKNKFFEKLKALGNCLKQNIAKMGMRLAYRIAKCILSGGF